ncbi:enolase C-terminal domain-like protein [Martelella sp. FLE1502]
MLDGPARPDIFMPDVKYLWPLDTLCDLLSYARKRGSRLSLHNPSGPISTAFSAHVCVASAAEEPLEFAFAAVESRHGLVGPDEPIALGAYHVSDRPGIGVSPTFAALEQFGEILAKGAL